jgi:hypothetical protein
MRDGNALFGIQLKEEPTSTVPDVLFH